MSELIFSIFALLYGLFTIYLRTHKKTKAWGKLEKMKNVYGKKTGVIIHIIYYTVVPIVIGIIGIAVYCLEIKIF